MQLAKKQKDERPTEHAGKSNLLEQAKLAFYHFVTCTYGVLDLYWETSKLLSVQLIFSFTYHIT
jgi:hypothetical protein